MIDTKKKILDTAERLFSTQGYDATSLRQIITEAGDLMRSKAGGASSSRPLGVGATRHNADGS